MNFIMNNNMRVFKLFIISLILIPSLVSAKNSSVYFSEVISIDRNNILTVRKNGNARLVKLAYLRTPIKNEYKNEIVNKYLKSTLLNKWVRISELAGAGKANVYRAIIRNDKQKVVNIILASKGYGVPAQIEQPPKSIFDASKIAQKNKSGIWENKKQFNKDITNTEGNSFLLYLEDVRTTLSSQTNNNNQIFVGDKKDQSFKPLKCANKFDKKHTVIFATMHVGIKRGYKFIPCPPKENNSK